MKNANSISFQKASLILKTMLIILMIFVATSLKAGDIPVKTGNADLKVKQNTDTKLQLSNSFTKLSYKDVKTNKGIFTRLSIPEYGTSNSIGDPQLPVLRKLIEIPLGADVNINVISYALTEYNLSDYGISNKIIPSQPSVSKDINKKLPDFEYNAATYNADQFNTNDLVSVDILGIMRGVRLARLNIAPVRYNSVTNTIRVYNDIEVEITFPGADVAQTIELKKKTGSMYFESMYNNSLLNYKKINSTKDTVTKYPVKYVIVSDPAFQSALQPFVQWKTKKGFTVIEAYTNNPAVGTTTTSIKNYLQGLYNAGTPSDPAPSFVLFVGDVAQVPSFNGTTGSHVSDLYYCEYTGDFLPEVYYGRFSATSLTELQPQINKTLEYEQFLMPDPSFLGKCVMIAGQDPTNGPLYGDGQINYGTSTYFNTAHGLTSHTYLYAVSGSSAAQIIQNVSDGVGFANYTAHGSSYGWADPSFSISDIAGLQNTHKYPLMIGNCCLTNTFDGDCFGEELLRANNKGALGYIGGSNSTYWDEDYWWGVGYKTVVVNPTYSASSLGSYDRTFHDHGEHFGEWYASQDQMIFAGNLAVTQSGLSSSDYYWEIYHLMGDPSLMVYFGVPPALTATYTPLIPLGSTTFTVNTEPYAYVAVSMNGILHGAALADLLGVANVPLSSFTVPGTADIVATKQNRAPFISTVTVATPSGPYVVYNSKSLHDVAGNNNGQADYGEDITLDIALQNLGATTATGVSAKLRTNDIYVTITDSTQSWGDIANSITSTQNNAYSFTVHDSVPDQHAVAFTLEITDNNSNIWTGTFNIVLNAPVLAIGNVTINDASGNNNGRLDPGETVDLIIASSNTGHANAVNVVSALASTMGSITVNTSSVNLDTLNASGGSVNATFNITVSSSAVIGSVADFINTLTAGLYSVQKNIYQMIGLVDEDWETGTFTKFPWVQGTHPWVITNIAPFEGTYCAKSGAITDNDTSSLQITFNVLANDSVSFYEKVSSEEDFDFLKFYIDGTEKGSWSGTSGGWSRATFPVTAGVHTFKWFYEKDNSQSDGNDCAWIDYILFPPMLLTAVNNYTSIGDNSLNFYPNPFSHSAVIAYSIEEPGKVTIKIFNAVGQEVATLLNGVNKPAGYYSVSFFNAEGLRAGIYHCVLITNDKAFVRKLIISE
jgi:hypothetical protein